MVWKETVTINKGYDSVTGWSNFGEIRIVMIWSTGLAYFSERKEISETNIDMEMRRQVSKGFIEIRDTHMKFENIEVQLSIGTGC